MLLEGRKPIDQSEKMIVNTHKTMLRIEQELYKENFDSRATSLLILAVHG
jgi:hypothetical protein